MFDSITLNWTSSPFHRVVSYRTVTVAVEGVLEARRAVNFTDTAASLQLAKLD